MHRAFLILMLSVLAAPGLASGHWEADGTPEIEQGTDSAPPFIGFTAGTKATAKVTAGGDRVDGEAKAHSSSIFEAAQNSASKGGKFFEKFRWVGDGEGRAACMGEVDTFSSMDLFAAAGQSFVAVRAESNVWDEPLKQEVPMSHSSASAPDIGSIGLDFGWVSVTLPIPAPGGNIAESYNEDPPSENTYGEKCLTKFWHKRLTFGYANAMTAGSMAGDGDICVSFFGAVSSSPTLGGECDDSQKKFKVPTTTCVNVDCNAPQCTNSVSEVVLSEVLQ